MGERSTSKFLMDIFNDPLEYEFMRPSGWGMVMPLDFTRIQDTFIVGIDPIEPILPKSEGDDLIFKTTPKYVL